MSLGFIFNTLGLLATVSFGQTCLNNPPAVTHSATGNDIEWTYLGSNTYGFNLVLQACAVDIAPGTVASFVTRCYNGRIPGYTLRMERGNIYNITMINDLGPENANNSNLVLNKLRHPNTTNVHVHGLHVSGQPGADYIFEEVDPGNNFTFSYSLVCNHAGGTDWYHPHLHGSTSIQAGGGAAGLLIIEDDAEMEGLPAWFTSLEEIHLTIYDVNLPNLKGYYEMSHADDLFRYNASTGELTDFYVVNGEYQPTICLNSNQWYRFRISHASVANAMYATLEGCTLKLLAKDGVLLHGRNNTLPRDTNATFFTQGSRADLAVYCPHDGSNNPTTYTMRSFNATVANTAVKLVERTILYINVTGTSTTPTSPATTLTPFNPIRPSYLRDLQYANESDFHTFCRLGGAVSCNGEQYNYTKINISPTMIYDVQFSNKTNYFFNITIGEYVQFYVNGENGQFAHPFHMHVNHVQIMETNNAQYPTPSNWYEQGDYHDVTFGDTWVRWYAATYGGSITMHCHILTHEDRGAMGTFWIQGGCDPNGNDMDSNYGSCDIPTCPTTAPSSSPTMMTDEPTMMTSSPTTMTSSPTTTTSAPTLSPTFTRYYGYYNVSSDYKIAVEFDLELDLIFLVWEFDNTTWTGLGFCNNEMEDTVAIIDSASGLDTRLLPDHAFPDTIVDRNLTVLNRVYNSETGLTYLSVQMDLLSKCRTEIEDADSDSFRIPMIWATGEGSTGGNILSYHGSSKNFRDDFQMGVGYGSRWDGNANEANLHQLSKWTVYLLILLYVLYL